MHTNPVSLKPVGNPYRAKASSILTLHRQQRNEDYHNLHDGHNGPGLAGATSENTTRVLMLVVAIMAGIGIAVGILLIFLFVIPAFTTAVKEPSNREWQEDPEAGSEPLRIVAGLNLIPHGGRTGVDVPARVSSRV
jgi:hypothetical protein